MFDDNAMVHDALAHLEYLCRYKNEILSMTKQITYLVMYM